jgi:hypothetical protein
MSDIDDLERSVTNLKAARDQSIVPLLRRIHPRYVIWCLMLALFALIGAIGRYYAGRLDAVEVKDTQQHEEFRAYQKTQNGHLHQIDLRLERIESGQQYQREMIEKIDKRLK